MIDMLFYFLPMILFLGIVTTVQDIKTGKIRNKWIMIALIYAIVVNTVLVVALHYSAETVRFQYVLELFVTFMLSLFLGFIMWWIGLWTAGDAKLFAAYSALVPLTVYRFGHLPFFSSSNILINTFVPFFIVYSLIMIFKTSMKQKKTYFLKAIEPMQLVYLLLFLFAFMWPVRLFFTALGVQGNYFAAITLLFVVLVIMERFFGERLLVPLIVIGVLRIILDNQVFSLNSLVNMLFIFVTFVFLRFFILYMAYDFMTKHVDIALLKTGMVPAECIYQTKGKYKKRPILHFSLLSYVQEKTRKRKYVFEPRAEGLTKEDVKRLKSLESELEFEHLRVYKTLSFAPYMFAGVLLTILFMGNMFITIALLLQ